MEVETINLTLRVAILEGGRVCRITNMFDYAGNETDDTSEARVIIIKVDEDNWLTVLLKDFVNATSH